MWLLLQGVELLIGKLPELLRDMWRLSSPSFSGDPMLTDLWFQRLHLQLTLLPIATSRHSLEGTAQIDDGTKSRSPSVSALNDFQSFRSLGSPVTFIWRRTGLTLCWSTVASGQTHPPYSTRQTRRNSSSLKRH